MNAKGCTVCGCREFFVEYRDTYWGVRYACADCGAPEQTHDIEEYGKWS